MTSQQMTPMPTAQTAQPEAQTRLREMLGQRVDFNGFAHDVSNSVLFALERRHLDYLNLEQLPVPEQVQRPEASELLFLKLSQIGHGPEMERSLDLLNMQNVLGTFRDG